MKKIISYFIAILLIINLIPSVAWADTDSIDYEKEAGMTPDSIFYFLDKTLEDIKLALTFKDIEKASLLTENAKERLAEIKILLYKENVDLANNITNDYIETIDEANEIITQLTDEDNIDNNDTDEDIVIEEEPKEEDEKNQALDELLNKNIIIQKNSIDVLEALLYKLPEEAKATITQVIVKQIMKTEAVKNYVEVKNEYNNARKAVKEAEKKVKESQKLNSELEKELANNLLQSSIQNLEQLEIEKQSSFEYKKNINTAIKEKLTQINGIKEINFDEEEIEPTEENKNNMNTEKEQNIEKNQEKNQEQNNEKENMEKNKEQNIIKNQENNSNNKNSNGNINSNSDNKGSDNINGNSNSKSSDNSNGNSNSKGSENANGNSNNNGKNN